MINKFLSKIFKKPEKESPIELICNILCCWLIIVGTCLIIDAQFNFQIGLQTILWQTAATVVAIFLVTRRWWIPIIYFGILIPVFLLSVSLSGDIYSFFESCASFISWWLASMPINSTWYSSQGFYLVHTFINIGITILFFSVSRITKRAPAVVLLAVVFLVFNYASGHIKYDIRATLFFVAGIFPLVAGEKFQKVKFPGFKNNFGVLGKKWLFVIASVFIAISVSFMSLGIATIVKGSMRNRFCSDIVADIQTSTNIFVDEQKNANVSLFELGLVTNSTYVGGNLYDIKSKVLATTNLTEPALVKVTTFDSFDGLNWVNSFEKSYRINGFWQKEENEFLSSYLAGDKDFADLVEKIGYKSDIDITLKIDSLFLPSIGQVWGLKENTRTENSVLFDARGRLFSYYGMKSEYSYTIETLIYNTTQKILSKQIKALYSKYPEDKDPAYNIESDFYKKHTKSIIELPKKLKKDIKKLKLEDKNYYDKALAISNYFSAKNGYIYTDKPSIFYKGDNIIDALCNTKKGHCMYYTAAMIAATRSVGIPSRLAAGYLTVESDDGKYQVIDRSSPYAWVECYIPNIGWVSFDPNPQKSSLGGQNSSNNNKKPEIPEMDDEIKESELKSDVEKNKLYLDDEIITTSFAIINVLIFLILLCVVLNTVFSPKMYELDIVRKRFKNNRKQAEFYYYDILRQLGWLGFRFRRGETLREVIDRFEIEFSSKALEEAAKVIEALNYGNITPEDKDIEKLFQARSDLEAFLKSKNNIVIYVIKRRLLLPIFSIKKFKLK